MHLDRDRDRDRFVKLAFCRADLLFELDGRHRIVFAAGALSSLMGADAGKLKGRPLSDLIAESDRPRLLEQLAHLPESGRIEDMAIHLTGAEGRALPAVLAGYRAADFGERLFLAVKINGTPAAEASEADGAAAAGVGLLARAAFEKSAVDHLMAHEKAGKRAQLTLLHVANLEAALKSLGIAANRKLLGAIAATLNKASLGGAGAGQIGGERFSIVHDEAVAVEDLNGAIEKEARKYGAPGEKVKVSASTLDVDGSGLSEEQVAKALVHTIREYCIKGEQGVRKSLSQVIHVLMSDTVKTVSAIRNITRRRDIDLVFMPICDLREGKIQHFEALTRFRDPDYAGSPFKLITLAEEVDIIAELDSAIVKKALDFLKADERGPLPPIAVNLSGKSLNSDAFVGHLHEVLLESRVDPDRIIFEITESAKVENLVNVNQAMQSFRRKGYKFSLDDFGAGSASFDYLNALDADYVKFDGPVVRRACGSVKGNDLLSTMAKMCARNKIVTVAEMVEDEAMANQVLVCGINYGQGWFFGKPGPDPYAFKAKSWTRPVKA